MSGDGGTVVGRPLIPSRAGDDHEGRSAKGGFSLLELTVVLVVALLAVTLVAPALIPPREPTASFDGVLHELQSLAIRRGETLVLRLETDGRWSVSGEASVTDGVLVSGRLSGFPAKEGGPVGVGELRISPLGACAWSLDGPPVGLNRPLDPLTCRAEER